MYIDIRKVIRDKNESLYRKIPRFIFSVIARIICEKEINEIIAANEKLRDGEFITSALDDLEVTRVVEETHLVEGGSRYLFASNHPLGGVDGFVLAEAIEKHCGPVKIVVNDILMNVVFVSGLFIPINKHGGQSSESAGALSGAMDSDAHILFFPAGLCSRKIDGVITDTEWKASFIKRAVASKRDIVPVYVDSTNSSFFYNFALWRKRLNIKANLEMALLPSELIKKRGETVRVVFGEPIPYTQFEGRKDMKKCVAEVRELCYRLK